ncbi:MAG: hypothetical protein V3T17_18740 [Pseudomonadales bacterium]
MYPAAALRLTVLICLLALSACTVQQRQINALADSLHIIGAKQTLQALEKIDPKLRDRAQYLLNRGTLKRLTGDLEASTIDLRSAKNIMVSLQATSVTENVAAVTVNETLRSYTGTPSERVLLHQLLAYNHLQQDDLDGARVEMLQADVTMREVAKADNLRGQLASAHYLTGIIYELNGEWDDAMISYRRVVEIMDEHHQSIPAALQDSLLQTSYRQGFAEEYKRYVKRFSRQAQTFKNGDRELLVLYADGIVSNKQQHFVSVYSIERLQNVSLAIPYYPPSNYRPQYFTLHVAGKYHRTQILENIEDLARQDLADELPRITATTLLRVVAKYQAAKKTREKQGDLAGVLVNIAATFVEQADLRSWNMLPSSLQVARIRIPAGMDAEGADLPGGLSSSKVHSFNHGNTLLLIADSVDR